MTERAQKKGVPGPHLWALVPPRPSTQWGGCSQGHAAGWWEPGARTSIPPGSPWQPTHRGVAPGGFGCVSSVALGESRTLSGLRAPSVNCSVQGPALGSVSPGATLTATGATPTATGATPTARLPHPTLGSCAPDTPPGWLASLGRGHLILSTLPRVASALWGTALIPFLDSALSGK